MSEILNYQERLSKLKLESILILRKEIQNDLKGLALNFPGPEKPEELVDWEPTTEGEFESIVEMEKILLEVEGLLTKAIKLSRKYSQVTEM